MSALLFAAALFLGGSASDDPWSALVASRAPRQVALTRLGPERSHFVSGFDEGSYPVQLLSAPPDPALASATPAPPQVVVEVLEYDSPARGVHYQLALEKGKTLYAVAPPLAGEKSLSQVTRRYGSATPASRQWMVADQVRSLSVLSYPHRKRLFLLDPEGETVLARVILP